jgi:hypothetical protein
MLVFPASWPNPKLYVHGAGIAHLGTYVENGADASPLTPIQSTENGIEFHYARTMKNVEVDQALAAVDGFAIKEDCTIKLSAQEENLAKLQAIIGTPDFVVTGGGPTDGTSSWDVGNGTTPQRWQMVLEVMAPAGATNALRAVQIWRVMLESIGAAKHMKNDVVKREFTFRAYFDVTAAQNGFRGLFKVRDS